LKNHLNIILPTTPGSSNWCPFLMSPHQHPVLTSPLPTRATCRAYLTLDLTTRIIFGHKTVAGKQWSKQLQLHADTAGRKATSEIITPHKADRRGWRKRNSAILLRRLMMPRAGTIEQMILKFMRISSLWGLQV
jgi:hypothetical protein